MKAMETLDKLFSIRTSYHRLDLAVGMTLTHENSNGVEGGYRISRVSEPSSLSNRSISRTSLKIGASLSTIEPAEGYGEGSKAYLPAYCEKGGDPEIPHQDKL